MSANLIITAVDNNTHYKEGLKVFLASMALNAPKESVYVYLMNCDSKYVKELHKINPNVTTQSEKTEEESPFVRNYIRHSLIIEQMSYYNKIAWIDNDSIIRDSLDELWEDIEPETIKFWYRKKKKDHIKFQGGVYVLGASEKSMQWCAEIREELNNCTDWYAPQLLMYTKFKEVGLTHTQLSEKYNDSKFKSDSIIWHCKSSHFEEEKYQTEYQRYL